MYENFFKNAAGNEKAEYCELESVKQIFQTEFKNQKKEILDLLIKTLQDSSAAY